MNQCYSHGHHVGSSCTTHKLSTRRPLGYLRMAYPAKPRPLESFPPEIARIVDRYRFSDVIFADADVIRVEEVV